MFQRVRLQVGEWLLPTCQGAWWLRCREGRVWWDSAAPPPNGWQLPGIGQGYPKSYLLGTAIKVRGRRQGAQQSCSDQSEMRHSLANCGNNGGENPSETTGEPEMELSKRLWQKTPRGEKRGETNHRVMQGKGTVTSWKVKAMYVLLPIASINFSRERRGC